MAGPFGIAGAFDPEFPPGALWAIIFDMSIVDGLFEFAPAPPPGRLGVDIWAMFGEFEPELEPEFEPELEPPLLLPAICAAYC